MQPEPASVLAERAIEKHDLKSYQLAERVGVSNSTMSRILNGKVEPRGDTYRKLLQLASDD